MNCSETSEKTRDHSCKNVEDASLHICESLLGSRFCLLRLTRTLAGRRVMLNCSARIASRGKSAQLSAHSLLVVGAFCRCCVDRWVERLRAVQSREAVGADVLCKEGKSWRLFKQALKSPFLGLRCDALRAIAKWTLCSCCYTKIFTNQKQSRSSSRYIFRISYEIAVCLCLSALVTSLSRLFLVLQISLRVDL